MKITTLEVTLDKQGDVKVGIWVGCESVEDLELLTAWLGLVKELVLEWQTIRPKPEPDDEC